MINKPNQTAHGQLAPRRKGYRLNLDVVLPRLNARLMTVSRSALAEKSGIHLRVLADILSPSPAKCSRPFSTTTANTLAKLFELDASSIVLIDEARVVESGSRLTTEADQQPLISAEAALTGMYLQTSRDSRAHLLRQIAGARRGIRVFGLTRNFFARDEMQELVIRAARRVPFTLYLMHPWCDSRKDRYRIEPIEAALDDPHRYCREILRPMLSMIAKSRSTRRNSGLRVLLYNFPCSFAIEQIDDSFRVMLYGHGVRGTDGPILLLQGASPAARFFVDQLDWLDSVAAGTASVSWREKGISVVPLCETELTPPSNPRPVH